MSAGGAGYSYITGGGGMILNRAGVTRLLAPPPDSAACSCPAPETPDDMQVGRCARRLELPVLHSGHMFQVSVISYHSRIVFDRFRQDLGLKIDTIK